MPPPLEYNNKYWENLLEAGSLKLNLENRLHLIFSLLIFLQISVAQLITFTFMSEIAAVRSKAVQFMGFTPTAHAENKFPPGTIIQRWYDSFPNAQQHLDNVI